VAVRKVQHQAHGQRLIILRNGLLRLHKTLLESERHVYERDVQPVNSPWEMLGLVMNDPWFAWLRQLSGLVAEIDERLASHDPATHSDAEWFIVRARSLLVPDEGGAGFERYYFEALQRDPNVVLAHAEMLRVLASLA
jgi:hypothetical protein